MPEIPPQILEKFKEYPLFYQAVWRACYEIPEGEVRTYAWIAERIGRPGAARAVGLALGANPFAPVIPCHRVLRSDGGLGGYSGAGGLKAKLDLLTREGVDVAAWKARFARDLRRAPDRPAGLV